MELPSWFKIENIIKNLNFSGWFKNENVNKNNKVKIIKAISGNQNIVIHNIANQNITVGDPSKLFEEQPEVYDNIDIYKEGLNILNLADDQIKSCGDFLMDFYKKIYSKSKRTLGTTKNPNNMLKGAIFAVGTKDFSNTDWMRHASSSLREIIYVWHSIKKDINNDFGSFYKNGKKLKPEETDTLNFLKKLYEYFSSVHHNDEVGILQALKLLENNSTLEIKDCLREDKFLKYVKEFFVRILKLAKFSDYKK